MNKLSPLKKTTLFIILLCIIKSGFSQIEKVDWHKQDYSEKYDKKNLLINLPAAYNVYKISTSSFILKMSTLKEQEINIPSPSGKFQAFIVKPSKVVADEVAHLYSIKTFTGYKKEDPSTLIACDISNIGFHAAVYSTKNSYIIEPILKDNKDKVAVFYKKNQVIDSFNCEAKSHQASETISNKIKSNISITNKKTYRLAIAAAGEFSQHVGGNPISSSNVLNALASGVNMISPIFSRDLGVHFNLVSNHSLVFLNPNTDPFNGDYGSQTHTVCENALGIDGFDIGHMVIWQNVGGAAFKGVVCFDAFKGNAYSGSTISLSSLWINYVCHEIGHQLGAEHNFIADECWTSVDNYRYEPGEGSSIMCYPTLCGPTANYANDIDPFFHAVSIADMISYINNTSCAQTDTTGNPNSPTANANLDIVIPKETPFILVGTGSDVNDGSSSLTYSWSQLDGTNAAITGSPDCSSTTQPLFKYLPPSANNYRSFPQFVNVLAGNNDQQWEKLPCTDRTMNFSLLVRDNNNSFGKIDQDRTIVSVANTGPFSVISPNGGEILNGNSNYNITWNVNGTNSHCSNIDILISTDGGSTFTVLADNTPNDGSETINIPNIASSLSRILIRCNVDGDFRAASTFYDVSNANFTINEQSLNVNDFVLSNIKLFPNPTTGNVTLDLGKTYQDVNVKILNILGQEIFTQKYHTLKSTELNLNSSKGVYFLRVHNKSSNNVFTTKIIKE